MARDPSIPMEKEQTAEDIAAAEAERDKIMQAEMINNVTESVMENIKEHLDQQESRMLLQVEEVGRDLKNQGMSNQK